jgi:single-stranded DNA-binding protein
VKSLNSRTNITSFELSMVEGWITGTGEWRERRNQILIEVVGKESGRVAKEARLGSWVTLEGYIRSEQFKGQTQTKARTLSVSVWEPDDVGSCRGGRPA